MPLELRPYQHDAVLAIRTAFIKGDRRVLYVLPTGGGKSLIFSYVAASTAARAKRVVILGHRQEIVDQISRSLDDMGVSHGMIAAGRTPSVSSTVQIAMVQTLQRRIGKYPPPDLLVVDEAHHSVAGGYKAITEAWPSAFVLGVTATPERLDGRGLIDCYQSLIVGPSIADLTAAKYLAPAVVYAPASPLDLSGVRTVMGDYEERGLSEVMSDRKIVGDAVEHYRTHAAGLPAVAFCVSIAHSEQVAAEFRAAGIRAQHVDGNTERDERRRFIATLGNGGLDVLTNCSLISEGVDVPTLGAAILLRPTKSLAMHLQSVGRALRPAPGKSRAIILDHADNTRRHGLPSADRDWTLEGRKRKPRAAGDEGPAIKQCPACYAMCDRAERACPACGEPFVVAPREIVTEAGQLVEYTESLPQGSESWLVSAPLRECLAWAHKADYEARVHQIAKARGYERGWAFHQIQRRRA